MGLFGKRASGIDWTQYDPAMGGGYGGGIPGNVPGGNVALPEIGPDPYADTRPQNPGFFGKGGMGSKLLMGALGGALDGIAIYGGSKPGYANARRDQAEFDNELQKAELLARIRAEAGGTEPSTIRTLRALGIDPQSARGQEIGINALTRPFMVGSPEMGFNMAGGAYGRPGNSPPPEAIAELRADPSGAAEFDEIFGPGASSQFLGQ